MKGIEYAIQHLTASGVSLSGLYKFFTPAMAATTVRQLGLEVSPQELSQQWQLVKNQLR